MKSVSLQTPPRPMFPLEEQERARRQELRWDVLMEDFDDQAVDWLEQHVGADRLQAWGPPDTSQNLLASISRQLSTPGLYESAPVVSNADAAARALVDPDGLLRSSGLWTLQQHVQYIAVGMGDGVVRDDLGGNGVTHRTVEPYNVIAWSTPDAPDEWVKVRELRLRVHPLTGSQVWTWDEFDISGTEPRYRVVMVDAGEEVDATNLFATVTIDGETVPAPAEGLSGPAYVWRDPDRDGEPFLPYTVYRSVDTRKLWNSGHMRGAVVGTLNGVAFFSYTGRSALDASGSAVVTANLKPMVSATRTVPVNGDGTGGPVIASVTLSPGSIVQMESIEDKASHGVYPIGPGVNLPHLSRFAFEYATQVAMSWGLNPGDVLRVSAESTSGAALAISEGGRRRFSRRVTPLFERADVERLRKLASMLKVAGLYDGPTGGWTVTYTQIELSPQEQEAERLDTDWRLANGYITPVEAYQRANPGVGYEAALGKLVEAQVQKAVIAAKVREALVAAGLPVPTDDASDSPDDSPDGDSSDDSTPTPTRQE